MDGQEYLNQISAKNRPMKKSKLGGLMSSKYVLFGLIAVAALVMVIIIGAILGGGRKNVKSLSIDLLLHVNNTSKVIEEYQKDVRSSDLRASSASLLVTLSDTSKKLGENGVNAKSAEKTAISAANKHKEALANELFEAKINGILDRIFAHKMAYEVSLIAAEEARIINGTGSSNLKDSLSTAYSSLENLYDEFNDFSEAK